MTCEILSTIPTTFLLSCSRFFIAFEAIARKLERHLAGINERGDVDEQANEKWSERYSSICSIKKFVGNIGNTGKIACFFYASNFHSTFRAVFFFFPLLTETSIRAVNEKSTIERVFRLDETRKDKNL